MVVPTAWTAGTHRCDALLQAGGDHPRAGPAPRRVSCPPPGRRRPLVDQLRRDSAIPMTRSPRASSRPAATVLGTPDADPQDPADRARFCHRCCDAAPARKTSSTMTRVPGAPSRRPPRSTPPPACGNSTRRRPRRPAAKSSRHRRLRGRRHRPDQRVGPEGEPRIRQDSLQAPCDPGLPRAGPAIENDHLSRHRRQVPAPPLGLTPDHPPALGVGPGGSCPPTASDAVRRRSGPPL